MGTGTGSGSTTAKKNAANKKPSSDSESAAPNEDGEVNCTVYADGDAWYYTGVAGFRAPSGSDYVLLDCGYRMPEMIVQMILHPEKRGVYTTESRPLGKASPKDHYPDYYVETEWGGIYRTSYVTPRMILGTLQCPQLTARGWVGISGQNAGRRTPLILPMRRVEAATSAPVAPLETRAETLSSSRRRLIARIMELSFL